MRATSMEHTGCCFKSTVQAKVQLTAGTGLSLFWAFISASISGDVPLDLSASYSVFLPAKSPTGSQVSGTDHMRRSALLFLDSQSDEQDGTTMTKAPSLDQD